MGELPGREEGEEEGETEDKEQGVFCYTINPRVRVVVFGASMSAVCAGRGGGGGDESGGREGPRL